MNSLKEELSKRIKKEDLIPWDILKPFKDKSNFLSFANIETDKDKLNLFSEWIELSGYFSHLFKQDLDPIIGYISYEPIKDIYDIRGIPDYEIIVFTKNHILSLFQNEDDNSTIINFRDPNEKYRINPENYIGSAHYEENISLDILNLDPLIFRSQPPSSKDWELTYLLEKNDKGFIFDCEIIPKKKIIKESLSIKFDCKNCNHSSHFKIQNIWELSVALYEGRVICSKCSNRSYDISTKFPIFDQTSKKNFDWKSINFDILDSPRAIYNNFLYRSLSKNEILASEKRAEEISKEIYDHQIAISEMEEALIEIELEEARNPIPLKDRGFFGF